MDAREASEVRIRELEEDIKTLTQRNVEREIELERSGIFLYTFLFYVVFMQCFYCYSVNICVQVEGTSEEDRSSEEGRGE